MKNRSPKMSRLVCDAIKNLHDRRGSTAKGILSYIMSEHKGYEPTVKRQLVAALQRGVDHGYLKRNRGHYVFNRDIWFPQECYDLQSRCDPYAMKPKPRRKRSMMRKKRGRSGCGPMRKRPQKRKRMSRSCGSKRKSSRRKYGQKRSKRGKSKRKMSKFGSRSRSSRSRKRSRKSVSKGRKNRRGGRSSSARQRRHLKKRKSNKGKKCPTMHRSRSRSNPSLPDDRVLRASPVDDIERSSIEHDAEPEIKPIIRRSSSKHRSRASSRPRSSGSRDH